MNGGVFRSAVTGADGEVDAGYLAMFWIMAVVITAIPFMCIASVASMWLNHLHCVAGAPCSITYDMQGLGVGIGAACTGFGVAIGAVGAFRMGDRPHMSPTTKGAAP